MHRENILFHFSELILKDRSREISGAAPPPYIRIFTAPEDGVLLQCEVRGAFPKPKVKWQSSDGSILPAEEPHVSERGGRSNITLLTTVTKTTSSHLHCVATQEDIGHVTHAEIYVSFSESTQWIPGILVGIVIGISLTVVAVKHCEMCQKYSNSYKGFDPQAKGLYSCPSDCDCHLYI
ncbi:selection and upkeep of intraepithelial T-cells protein 3 [Lates calcarifer]|uniref:Selection and upkeep of intraepithelial T-cells protein 3 n=1 Tax=Lates calcarifer TaxID=8187 RepID=A0AAJ7PCP4_LATCA|nr:selection and upkeep of intraepithelial T-cells protein 3 [Lates calcarifer]